MLLAGYVPGDVAIFSQAWKHPRSVCGWLFRDIFSGLRNYLVAMYLTTLQYFFRPEKLLGVQVLGDLAISSQTSAFGVWLAASR